ncbi:MAG TPA: TIM barrel protein [Candidatus Acidoferrum sp.]|nr:TIM barrel protein [Candidatus Acidoferrum sp.]
MTGYLKSIPFIIVLAVSISNGVAGSFGGPWGIQLYSLRTELATNVPGTLDEVKRWGVKNVELAGTYGLTAEQFKAQLDLRGLTPVSAHFDYGEYRTNLDAIVRDARVLGLKYAGCAWIPRDDKKPFDEQKCREAIAVFNRAGKVLARHGITFFYHSHGYEFQPYGDGTLFDLMMKETNPKYVHFQMDVFWIVHAGQDPVALFKKYPRRWELMHLKGMRDSTPTGLLTGQTDVTNDVALDTGKIDYAPVLREAKKIGIQWYFIEDESPSSEQQIPESIRYLKKVTW